MKGKIRYTFVIILLFLVIIPKTKAQVNYVPNPSFETLDTCAMQIAQAIQHAIPWDTLKNGGGCDPGLVNTCCNTSPACFPGCFFCVPKHYTGSNYQLPRTGNGFAVNAYYLHTVPTATNVKREYIQAPLKDTLKVGNMYCVTYYVNLSNRSPYAIDRLGVYFDNGTVTNGGGCYNVVALSPQVESPPGFYVTDTLNWTKIQATFIANGTESYITFGNFNTQAVSYASAIQTKGMFVNGGVAEYSIDDISVIEYNLPAYAGLDQTILFGDSIFIGRPPEIGLECTWTTGTTTIGLGGGLWVKPNITTIYVVTQNICGNIKTDTVKVTVDYVGIKELNNSNINYSISPNPTNSHFDFEIFNKDFIIEGSEVKIINKLGQEVRTIKLQNKKQQINIENLESGIYYLQLYKLNKILLNKKIIKQ